MRTPTDPTLDPELQSWVTSANADGTDSPIQNLPFSAFRRLGSDEPIRMGVAIGDQVLDLRFALDGGGWADEIAQALEPLAAGDLNGFIQRGSATRRAVRAALFAVLAEGSAQQAQLRACPLPQAQAEMVLPCRIGDDSDFYISARHATSIGRQFRPNNPLLPNDKWVPIGYHGRASTIQVSGQAFRWPLGQIKAADKLAPVLAPLD